MKEFTNHVDRIERRAVNQILAGNSRAVERFDAIAITCIQAGTVFALGVTEDSDLFAPARTPSSGQHCEDAVADLIEVSALAMLASQRRVARSASFDPRPSEVSRLAKRISTALDCSPQASPKLFAALDAFLNPDLGLNDWLRINALMLYMWASVYGLWWLDGDVPSAGTPPSLSSLVRSAVSAAGPDRVALIYNEGDRISYESFLVYSAAKERGSSQPSPIRDLPTAQRVLQVLVIRQRLLESEYLFNSQSVRWLTLQPLQRRV